MSQICKNCGAVIADGERMCINCGKVLPKQRKLITKNENQFSAINQGMYENKQMTDVKRQFSPTMAASNQTYSKERTRVARRTFEKNKKLQKSNNSIKMNFANTDFDAQANSMRPSEVETGSGNAKKSKLHPLLNKIGWTIAIIVFLYFAFGGVMIIIARNSTYDFGVEGKKPMVADTYGEAIYNYFDSGWWHFRFGEGVTYKGKTKEGEEFELFFSRRNGKLIVDEIRIDGEEVEVNDLMQAYIMPMFLAESKP